MMKHRYSEILLKYTNLSK